MSDLEIDTLALRALDYRVSKTTEEIASEVARATKYAVSESEIFDILIKSEASGFVKRLHNDQFDEARPVTSTSWILVKDVSLPIKQISHDRSTSPPYVEDAMIVVSQPIFLSTRGLNMKNLGIPVLEVREAMQKMVMECKEELLIACPYYDELFIDILSTNPQNVSKLKRLQIISEASDPILAKACRLFPNAKVKTLYGSVWGEEGKKFKVQGIHAKVMIADRSQVLVGSFNFRSSHVTYNVDMGLLSKGKIAEHYAKIFDSIWSIQM